MNLYVVGCTHHEAPIEIRERLAFSPEETTVALDRWRDEYPGIEAVLLSTCNRTELYVARDGSVVPEPTEVNCFLAAARRLSTEDVVEHLSVIQGRAAIEHLFRVAASLDSMVVGEAQILAQVKQAYQRATCRKCTGPVLHSTFQAALRAARRVAGETSLHQRRVSIPSVAVADFAQGIFERFDDKHTLVVGAGEMAEETLRYLVEQGVSRITIINRNAERAEGLAARWNGTVRDWDALPEAIRDADVAICTTGAAEPIITAKMFARVEAERIARPLFILDLAVPRDVEPAVGDRPEVYLYAIDDLREACERNRDARDRELPAAEKLVREEVERFMIELNHRATGPFIRRLREDWKRPKEAEIERLFRKLPELDDASKEEIRYAFDRLVNKLLHPPMESLRDEAESGKAHVLLDAFRRLFKLED